MKNSKEKTIKYSSLLMLLFVCVFKMGAQNVELGFRFMPTVSKFDMQSSNGETVQGKAVLGYGFGGFLGYNFGPYVGIQGEVIYSSITQQYSESNVDRKVNLRYVNVPLLLSLNTGKTNLVNLNVVAGPQLGIRVGSNVFTSGADGTTPAAVLEVKKEDLGLAYGAGLDFGLNHAHTTRLGLGFRSVYGLFNISDNSGTAANNSYYILEKANVRTNSVYIGLSILF